MTGRLRISGGMLLACSLLAGAAGPASAQGLQRVSVSSAGAEGDAESAVASVSADGRRVAFVSLASTLVAGDTNDAFDVFVRDLPSGETTRVSTGPGGAQANGGSGVPSLSGDGRYVAFHSIASNLVAGDTNDSFDVFVHDTLTGETERVSTGAGGAEANWHSLSPSMSADGRHVGFLSRASNLVPGDGNERQDAFVHDTLTSTTTRVSVGPAGAEGDDHSSSAYPSDDGRHVTFGSAATNLVPGDTNGANDVFVRDTVSGVTMRVSTDSDGAQGDGPSFAVARSPDGRHVLFDSIATNLVKGDTNGVRDAFLHDLAAGETRRVSVGPGGSEGDGQSFAGAVSEGGRHVVFDSDASNLVDGDTNGVADVFARDLGTGATTRVSVGSAGTEGDGHSLRPDVSPDGRHIAFDSLATNLVAGDTNGARDVFLLSRDLPSPPAPGGPGPASPAPTSPGPPNPAPAPPPGRDANPLTPALETAGRPRPGRRFVLSGFSLSCPPGLPRGCAGSVKIYAIGRVPAASRRTLIAKSGFTVPSGETRRLRARLTRRGRALLRRKRRARVTITVLFRENETRRIVTRRATLRLR